MPSDAPNGDDGTNAQIGRLIAARQHLEQAAATVLREAADAHKLGICGTDELPAALSALESAEYLDTEEDAARWVSRAFTAYPTGLLRVGASDVELALCGAVMILRSALAELDEAKR
jgi:hypothetical protein